MDAAVYDMSNVSIKRNYFVEKPWDHANMEPLHKSMRNPRYSDSFYD